MAPAKRPRLEPSSPAPSNTSRAPSPQVAPDLLPLHPFLVPSLVAGPSPEVVSQQCRLLERVIERATLDESTEGVIARCVTQLNGVLGLMRDRHQLQELRLVGDYPLGLLTTRDLTVEAVLVCQQRPTADSLRRLGVDLATHMQPMTISLNGTIFLLTGGSFTIRLSTTYLAAWSDDPFAQPLATELVGVDVFASRQALLLVRLTILLEERLPTLPCASPAKVMVLFRLLALEHLPPQAVSLLDLYTMAYKILSKGQQAPGLAGALLSLLRSLASGSLCQPPLGEGLHPLFDFPVALFPCLTAEELNSLVVHHRLKQQPQPLRSVPEPSLAVQAKALEMDVRRVDPLVHLAQRILRIVAFEPAAWSNLFGLGESQREEPREKERREEEGIGRPQAPAPDKPIKEEQQPPLNS